MFQPRASNLLARLRTAALAALLVSTLLPAAASPTLAADDSDIPGVPLPGSVVTGRLGGSFYDRVYWIDVEPNRIILLSLTGDAGTDFDLYLFDSSATSVYGGQGQVAASTGSTSTESISYPARSGGRYYIDASGFSEVEGNFRLVVAIATDTTLPGAEVRLNGGATATTDPTVRVSVIGTDDLSGVSDVQFSENGTTWTDWQAYRPLILWTFEDRDGPKHLMARVRDASGNVSATAESSIVLDRVAPAVVETLPASGATGVAVGTSVSVRFSEPVDTRSLKSGGISLQDAAGRSVPAAIAWDGSTNTARITPSAPLAPNTSYTAAIGPVTDNAGNAVVAIGAWTFTTAAHTHTVSLVVPAAAVSYGATVRLTGRIDLPLGSPLILERSVAGGLWTTAATLVVDSAGAFSRSVTAVGNTHYRARVIGSPTEAAVASSPARLIVRRGVAVAGHSPTVTKVASVGRTIATTVLLSPSEPAVLVTLTVSRYDTPSRSWRTVTTLKKTSVSGRATFSWRPTRTGSWSVRVTTPPGTLFANAISPTYRWTIR